MAVSLGLRGGGGGGAEGFGEGDARHAGGDAGLHAGAGFRGAADEDDEAFHLGHPASRKSPRSKSSEYSLHISSDPYRPS